MFERAQLKAFRNDFAKAVEDLEKKYGVSIEMGTIRFGEYDFTARITATAQKTGDGKDVEKVRFVDLARAYGIDPEWYGKTIKSGGKTLTIVGINPKAQKNRIELRDESTGKGYKTSVNMVKALLALPLL